MPEEQAFFGINELRLHLSLPRHRFIGFDGRLVLQEFLCPISMELMISPVMVLQTGQIYDNSSFTSWLLQGRFLKNLSPAHNLCTRYCTGFIAVVLEQCCTSECMNWQSSHPIDLKTIRHLLSVSVAN